MSATGKEPENGGAQDAFARDVGVVHPDGQARHHRHTRVPVEARPVGDHHLIRGEGLPSVFGLARVEGARVPHTRAGDHRLPLVEHQTEVAPDRSGQTLQLAEVDPLGMHGHARRIQPRP
jgi:hypothetical protein